MGAENLAANETRSPDRPARSESLYRLSYPGPESRSQFTPMIINNKSVSVLLHVQKIHRLLKKSYSKLSCVRRAVFGTRSDEVTGEWRRLHNEELNDL